MNKFALFSVAFCCSWAAATMPPAQALCLNEDAELTFGDVSLDDTEFVNSSPARSDSEFKLEVNLSDLGSLTRPQDESEPARASSAAPLPTAELEPPSPGAGRAEEGAAVTLSGDSLDGLGETVISLEDQPIEPRADFLADFAEAFNTCSEP